MFIQILIPILLLFVLVYIRRRVTWKLLKRYHSDISGNIDVSRKWNGEKVLMTNYFVQGVSIEDSSIKKSYWYRVAVEAVHHCRGKKDPTVLFIGLGANTSSQLIQGMDTAMKQVIVEIDPLIIEACREYFHLDTLKNAEIIQADIFDILRKKRNVWKKQFDVIVIDTFDAKPPYMLKGSHDPEFLNPLYEWLKIDGMFLFNTPVKTEGKKIEELLEYLHGKFINVHHTVIKDPRGYRNHVIAASEKK